MSLTQRAWTGLAALWDAFPSPLRRRVLFGTNDHFLLGVVGLVYDAEGRILVLEHRFRTPFRWGLPGGFIEHDESMPSGLEREIAEEIGLRIRAREPAVDVELVQRGRYLSVALLAELVDPPEALRLDQNPEIVGGGFFDVDALPDGTYPYHRRLIERLGRPSR